MTVRKDPKDMFFETKIPVHLCSPWFFRGNFRQQLEVQLLMSITLQIRLMNLEMEEQMVWFLDQRGRGSRSQTHFEIDSVLIQSIILKKIQVRQVRQVGEKCYHFRSHLLLHLCCLPFLFGRTHPCTWQGFNYLIHQLIFILVISCWVGLFIEPLFLPRS